MGDAQRIVLWQHPQLLNLWPLLKFLAANAPDSKTRPSASNLSSSRECLCGANLRDGRAVELRWKQEEPTLALVHLGTSFSAGLARAFSRRNEATLKQLLTLLAPYKLRFYCTDNLNTYAKYLP